MPRKLSKREKYSLYLAIGFIFLFAIMQFVVFPVIDKKAQLKRTLKVKTRALNEMLLLKSEYDSIIKKTAMSEARITQREKGFTLFSFLDKLAGSAGLKDNINYMKPTSLKQPDSPYKKSQVEMKLQQITMDQLTRFLHGIESSPNSILIKRLSISKKGKAEGTISVVIQAETLES